MTNTAGFEDICAAWGSYVLLRSIFRMILYRDRQLAAGSREVRRLAFYDQQVGWEMERSGWLHLLIYKTKTTIYTRNFCLIHKLNVFVKEHGDYQSCGRYLASLRSSRTHVRIPQPCMKWRESCPLSKSPKIVFSMLTTSLPRRNHENRRIASS